MSSPGRLPEAARRPDGRLLRGAAGCGPLSTTSRWLPLVLASGLATSLPAQERTIEQAAWLAGCWHATLPDGGIDEHWMRPAGAAMVGMSRTVRGGRLVGHELALLREVDTGLVYEAHPSGQSSTRFHATTVSDTLAVFENPEHDFPRLVGYRRASGDSLLAWIVGPVDGREQRIEFHYRRVACPGP